MPLSESNLREFEACCSIHSSPQNTDGGMVGCLQPGEMHDPVYSDYKNNNISRYAR
jgi:hypothetical protein